MIRNAEPHTFFPIDWDEKKALQEFVSALINPNKSKFRNKKDSFFTTSNSRIKIGWFEKDGIIKTFFSLY